VAHRRDNDYAGVLRSARGLIEELIGGLGKPTDDDPSPTLLDRLSFSWAFLRQADMLVWKLRKNDLSDRTGIEGAKLAFQGILPLPLMEHC
jgi:hypothetical protein